MNVETLIARKMEARRAAGLHVRVTFDGRVPFNHYAKSIEDRDAFIASANRAIGKADKLGHVVRAVEIVG